MSIEKEWHGWCFGLVYWVLQNITVDSVLEEQINNTLCETFESFSNTIINNFRQQFLEEENENYNGHELVSHNMDIVDSNNEALEELCDVLDEVTDALETINENI